MKIKELLSGDKKHGFGIYILLLLGVALLAFGSAPFAEKSAPAEENEEKPAADVSYIDALEKRLAEVLSSVDGAGEVRVLLVPENSGSIDVQRDGSGETSKTVVLSGQNGSEALVLAERAPAVRGAIVVARGAGNDRVRAELAEAAATALGVGAHRVKVCKMK